MPLNLKLPKARGLFITGTDTGVGKTLVAGGIARVLSRKGVKVGVFKPVASGCRHEREGLVSNDAEFLAFAADTDQPLSVINPVTFAIPAAPVVCEEREKRQVDFEAIAVAYRHLCKVTDFILVEGIGGVRVPISRDVDVLDMMKAFRLPVLVVTRPDLGTINHTLLTLDAIRNAGLALAGLVINGYDTARAGIAEETVADVLREWGRIPLLAVVPRDPASNVEQGRLGRTMMASLERVDWFVAGRK
ncbi:MAG: dethiobiotin synthase [Sedimentisphaerales bacterium]|nr:dethiobiotin synthase [Sedimentisphaerales bacterium]